MSPTPPQRSRYFLFSLIPLVFLLISVEAGLRVYDWSRGASAEARAYWYWGFVQDRLTGYRARPNLNLVMAGGRSRLDTNSQGFRDQELAVDSVQPRRLILCLGESSTWGTGSSSRLTTWPHQLHELLRQEDPSAVVFNAGMPGYTVVENLQLLNHRLLKYRPEAVLYMGIRNDVEFYMRSLSADTDLNLYARKLAPLPSSFLNNLVLKSSLGAMIASRLGDTVQFDRQTPAGEPQQGKGLTPRGVEAFRDQIALMKTLCDRHGVKLLWVDQPVDAARSTIADSLKTARGILREELSQEGIPLLQAQTLYDFRKYPLVDDVHFDDAGSRYLASLLAPQLLAEINRPGSAKQGQASH